jgi:hypothetical protein
MVRTTAEGEGMNTASLQWLLQQEEYTLTHTRLTIHLPRGSWTGYPETGETMWDVIDRAYEELHLSRVRAEAGREER